MKTHAHAVITVRKYEPAAFDEPAEGPALTRIHVEESLSGDISGDGVPRRTLDGKTALEIAQNIRCQRRHRMRPRAGGAAARAAEQALGGAPATEQMATRAADAELAVARPLAGNAFKAALARGTLIAVMRELTEEATP
jgi:hypothetical protein